MLTMFRTPRSCALFCAAAVALTAGSAVAQNAQNYLQWFEAEWNDIERRTPDFFLAGYNAVWLPPVSKTSGFNSPDTGEIYVGITAGVFAAKYSYASSASVSG